MIFLIGECRPPLFVLFFLIYIYLFIYLFILFILEPFPPPLESTPWRTRVDDSSLKGRGDRASWKISCMKRVAEQLTVAMVLVGMATSWVGNRRAGPWLAERVWTDGGETKKKQREKVRRRGRGYREKKTFTKRAENREKEAQGGAGELARVVQVWFQHLLGFSHFIMIQSWFLFFYFYFYFYFYFWVRLLIGVDVIGHSFVLQGRCLTMHDPIQRPFHAHGLLHTRPTDLNLISCFLLPQSSSTHQPCMHVITSHGSGVPHFRLPRSPFYIHTFAHFSFAHCPPRPLLSYQLSILLPPLIFHTRHTAARPTFSH